MNERNAWWRETAIYQIYPRSFADSNGDGIGDLPGIIAKLDYIKDLGFETVWLSPHYASPQRDFGYDITDYYRIAPEYGSHDDAVRLIAEVHRRGMKIVFDMILNHTSDEHAWFLESRSSRDNPKRDWYIWRDGKGKRPPNNWAAIPGGSGWAYDETTGQWYFHNFLPFQPDLNFRNPAVKAAMLDTLRFWLAQGVDGFRLDIFHSVFKDEWFRDNPFSWRFVPTDDQREGYFQKLQYNLNRPETFAFAREIRALIDEYQPPRFVVGEVFGDGVVRKYLGEKGDGLNLILLFDLIHRNRWKAEDLKAIIRSNEAAYPEPLVPTYALGNHDRRRYFSRIGEDPALARLLALFLYTARGVPINYYGDELGIPDGYFAHKGAKDSLAHPYGWLPKALARKLNLYINRDGCRTPMQWDDSPYAGFSTTQPWLPVHAGYASCNVESQRKDAFSILNTHRNLLRLRQQKACLRRGSMNLLPDAALPADVVGYERTLEGETVRVLLNFSRAMRVVELPGGPHEVLVRSDSACTVSGNRICLGPRGGVVTGG
jgi:oligo-1,6-glucosidase/alpha-glucosidase